MRRYEDFSITFRPGAGERFEVLVQSPAGSADGTFALPFPITRMSETLQSLAEDLRSDTADGRGSVDASRDIGRVATRTVPELRHDFGVQLFNALFEKYTVRDRFMSSLGMVERAGHVLRVRLHMNLDDESVRPLASLPWELLHDPDQRKNLVEWPTTALVRSLDIPASNARPPFEPPLRVLFVMANPHRDLDLARERTDIEARLAAAPDRIDSLFLEGATYDSLTRALHDHDFHIVHFMGHGGFHDRGGVLLFERDDRGEDAITAAEFGRLILGETSTRLVVLNACRTAETSQHPEIDPYSGGVATALVMAGVPAVVAMQFPISDAGAVNFSDRLYSMLARGETIEAAVREGRRAIRAEWPIPVLFSRCDPDLFTPPAGPTSTSVATIAAAGARVSARAPRSPVVSEDARDLLPYLVDRLELMYQLDEAVRLQNAAPSLPFIGIVHGDDEQCQDGLLRRLIEFELPRVLGIDERMPGITPYQLQWPEGKPRGSDLHKRLTARLASAVTNCSTPEQLQRFFSTLPAPAMVHSHLVSTDWEESEDSLLDDFLDYWQAWPGNVAPQRLLVFVFIKYQVPPPGWLRGRRTRRTNESVEALIGRLESGARDGIVLKVLPRLRGILQTDVEAWNRDNGFLLDTDAIKQFYVDHGAFGSELPMNTLAKLLSEALAATASTTGGVR